MKTKLRILLLTAFLFANKHAQAEIKTIIVDPDQRSAKIEIKDHQVGKCVFAKLLDRHQGRGGSSSDPYLMVSCAYIKITKSGKSVIIRANSKTSQVNNMSMNALPVIEGPATVELVYEQNYSSILTLEITPNETAAVKAAGPTLVLPEGEDGKQKLVLESSTDLVNWMEDSLGSKDSSDKKRFYRLRAVKE